MSDHITVLAQLGDSRFTHSGIQQNDGVALGLDCESGLLVLARNKVDNGLDSALKSVQILLDDMSVNLSRLLPVARNSIKIVSLCLNESLQNINEYLLMNTVAYISGETATAVELAAIQLDKQKLVGFANGSMRCLRFSVDKLHNVTGEPGQRALGVEKSFQLGIVRQPQQEGDVLLLTTNEVLSTLQNDFIRLTLSRFSENLEMALRQINTRAAHQGLEQKPLLIVCRINQKSAQASGGWLNKLRRGGA